jgi:hypothetical protein
MPTATIDRHQRAGLYELVRNHCPIASGFSLRRSDVAHRRTISV